MDPLLVASIDIALNRLIDGMYCLPCSGLLELLVVTAKIHFEEQTLVAGTKKSTQADKAVGLACFVWCPLLALALPSGFCSNKYTLNNLFISDIYGWFI